MLKAVIKKIKCKDGKVRCALVVNGTIVSFDHYLMCRVARCRLNELEELAEPP